MVGILPNLLIIGAPKSGTATVKYALKSHPEVFFAPDNPSKEPHFLTYSSEGWPSWAIRHQVDYERLFEQSDSYSVRAEKSTWYLYSKGSAKLAAELLPEVKAIALLRNPIQRAFSAFQFNRQHGWEQESNFLKALQNEPGVPEFSPAPDKRYSSAGLYFDGLRRWQEALGAHRVKTIIFDDLRDDTKSQLSSVCEFLGVSDCAEQLASMPAQNKTNSVRSSRLVNLKRQFKWTKRLMPGAFAKTLSGTVDTLNKQNDKPKLEDEAAEFLYRRHREDIEKTSKLLGCDLVDKWFSDFVF